MVRSNTKTTLTFLDKTIAKFHPQEGESSSSKPPPPSPEPPTTHTTTSKKRKKDVTEPAVQEEQKEKEEMTTEKKGKQKKQRKEKQPAIQQPNYQQKKVECKKYREYIIEKGRVMKVVGGKEFVDGVKLKLMSTDKKVLDEVQVAQGCRVNIWEVGERAVVGISRPTSGHKYTIYIHDTENNEVHTYPLMDVTEIFPSGMSNEEQSAADKWWAGVRGVGEEKEEETKEEIKQKCKKQTATSRQQQGVNTNLVAAIKDLSSDLSAVKASVAQLHEDLVGMKLWVTEKMVDITHMQLSHDIDIIRACHSNSNG
jgi:hypothetical protein